jgi:two-component system phosphate regulon sensor histidine kinase PhoR
MFENKKMELRQEVFDLADAVNEVVASLRLQAEKCQATISVDAEGDFMVRGDRLHLLSVIFNLLDNALKYCRENPRILISLREDANHVVMKVSDNGMGIPTEYHEKIFEKFFRVPAGDTHNAKGHGLGLSYIRQVVQQHGGIIAVESREGAGSSFSIRLPKNMGQENK